MNSLRLATFLVACHCSFTALRPSCAKLAAWRVWLLFSFCLSGQLLSSSLIFNPIFQDLPAHIYMLSMFVANLVRYSNLLFPANSRPTLSLLLPLCWLVSLLLVLPYLPNIQHYDLQNVSKCNGGQLCALEEDEARGKLVRGTFLLL